MLGLVLRLRATWDAPQTMKVYFADRLRFTGSSSAFTNPVIEAEVIHCRALLEFLGLKVDTQDSGKLAARVAKKADDWVIEDFSRSDGSPLIKVTPEQAISRYPNRAEAEQALAGVLHTANKGLAHFTAGLNSDATEARLLEIASRGVHALVVSHFHTPLGLPEPSVNIQALEAAE
jgi:hypothetical protein